MSQSRYTIICRRKQMKQSHFAGKSVIKQPTRNESAVFFDKRRAVRLGVKIKRISYELHWLNGQCKRIPQNAVGKAHCVSCGSASNFQEGERTLKVLFSKYKNGGKNDG